MQIPINVCGILVNLQCKGAIIFLCDKDIREGYVIALGYLH